MCGLRVWGPKRAPIKLKGSPQTEDMRQAFMVKLPTIRHQIPNNAGNDSARQHDLHIALLLVFDIRFSSETALKSTWPKLRCEHQNMHLNPQMRCSYAIFSSLIIICPLCNNHAPFFAIIL